MSRGSTMGRALDAITYICDDAPGPVSKAGLADALDIDPKTAGRWLQLLERRGFVQRVSNGGGSRPILWRWAE